MPVLCIGGQSQGLRLAGTVDQGARKQPKADYPQGLRLAGTVDQGARKQPGRSFAASLASWVSFLDL